MDKHLKTRFMTLKTIRTETIFDTIKIQLEN